MNHMLYLKYNLYALLMLFRDRLRTTINVMGDTFAAAVVAKYSQKDFAEERPHGSSDSLELFDNLANDVVPESEETNL